MKRTPEEITRLQDAADQRIREGWSWMEVSFNSFILMPPVDDPRFKWAAEYIQVSPVRSVPHWIEREPDSRPSSPITP